MHDNAPVIDEGGFRDRLLRAHVLLTYRTWRVAGLEISAGRTPRPQAPCTLRGIAFLPISQSAGARFSPCLQASDGAVMYRTPLAAYRQRRFRLPPRLQHRHPYWCGRKNARGAATILRSRSAVAGLTWVCRTSGYRRDHPQPRGSDGDFRVDPVVLTPGRWPIEIYIRAKSHRIDRDAHRRFERREARVVDQRDVLIGRRVRLAACIRKGVSRCGDDA